MTEMNPSTTIKATDSITLESPLCEPILRLKDSFYKFSSSVKWAPLIAGVSGGVISTASLHPLDLIKVRLQVNDGLRHNGPIRPQYSGMIDTAVSIAKQAGIRGLYQGAVPNLVGAGSSWGLYFFAYNNLKVRRQNGNKQPLGAHSHMWLGAQAGAFTLLLTNPIWVAKTRLCLQYDQNISGKKQFSKTDPKHFRGMVDCLRKTYKTDGICGLYKGFVPGLFGVSHGALQFMAYEEFKKLFNSFYKQDHDAKLGTFEYLTCSAVSKMFAASVTYPYQVVRCRLQDQHRKYDGVLHVVRETYRNESWRGFFKGMVPGVIKVTPAACITFVVYEHLMQYLEHSVK